MRFVIDLTHETEAEAFRHIENVIAQAQAGVTEFSPVGTLAHILMSLDMKMEA